MVAASKNSLERVRGDQWDIGPITHRDRNRNPIDLTGCVIDAVLEYPGTSIALNRELGELEAGTGYVWVDQAGGKYLIKIDQSVTGDLPGSTLVLRYFDSNGRRRTKAAIKILATSK